MPKIPADEIFAYANSRGGKCVSTKIDRMIDDLEWECIEGHRWKAPPHRVVRKRSWCPVCSGHAGRSLEFYRPYAEKRGGKLISKRFKGSKTYLKWECANGHKWMAPPDRIKQGKWCPFCSGRAGKNLIYYSEYAKKKGGRCLSKTYVNSIKKLKWECSEGHKWAAAPAKVKLGRWCPVCAGNIIGTLKEMRAIALSRGGKCLSKKYVNTNSKLEWKCAKGHTWRAQPMAIRRGTWCPECKSSIGEAVCREIFQKLFKEKFKKVRPAWLISPNGSRMELDGFSSKLNLAFEHQGRQHERSGSWGTGKTEIEERQRLDKIKLSLCKTHGIKLILIPEIGTRIPMNKALERIIVLCNESGLDIPKSARRFKISYLGAYNNDSGEQMKALCRAVRKKGGELLTKSFLGVKFRYALRCKNGHKWDSRYDHIMAGVWCDKCVREAKIDAAFKRLRSIAKRKGLECKSKRYSGLRSKLRWQCKMGHRWMETPESVKKNQTCPTCASEKD